MKLVKVEPREIAVILEFTVTEIQKLERFLSNSKISYDDPELADAAGFVTEQFYPNIQMVLKGLQNA